MHCGLFLGSFVVEYCNSSFAVGTFGDKGWGPACGVLLRMQNWLDSDSLLPPFVEGGFCARACALFGRDDTAIFADTDDHCRKHETWVRDPTVHDLADYKSPYCMRDSLEADEGGCKGFGAGIPATCSGSEHLGTAVVAIASDECPLTDCWVWLAIYTRGFFLSFLAMVLAAQIRLLLFGLRLKGGAYNADPILRSCRATTRGAHFCFLLFAVVARPCAGIPNQWPSQPVTAEAATALRRITLFHLDQQLEQDHSQCPLWVERSIGEVAPPVLEQNVLDVLPEPPDDEEVPWRRMAVRVFMFDKVDKYISVWLQEGFVEQDALQLIASALVLDLSELSIYAVRPQLPGDTLDVAVVPTWWKEGHFRFFILDGTEANRPAYMCTVPATCDFAALQAAAGPHLVDGLDVFLGNSTQPLCDAVTFDIQDADLLRVRYSGRPRVVLPTMEEALSDLYWARDVVAQGLPRAPDADGRILVIRQQSRYVHHADPAALFRELHQRLARAARSNTTDLALILPRGDFELPAYRGTPLEYIVALQPRDAHPDTASWTGVFVDPRDLGLHFDFLYFASDDLAPTDVTSALGFDVLPDYEAYINGYDGRLPGGGKYRCLIGGCLTVWLDRPGLVSDEDTDSQMDDDDDERGPSDDVATNAVDPGDDGHADDDVNHLQQTSPRATPEDTSDAHSDRSRTPRNRGRPTNDDARSAGDDTAGCESDGSITLHAVVHTLQHSMCRLSSILATSSTVDAVTQHFREAVFRGCAERDLMPLRPQFATGELQYIATAPWVMEAGRFPCLVDAS